ncbi:13667_t:CDS:2, partial [Racocetra fulgida]
QKLQILEIGSEFLTVESFKEAAQQSAKAAGFAFSISSSKVLRDEKGSHTPFVTLQCIMGGKYRNNHNITEETQKRKKSTKRQSCLVILKAILNKNNVWVVHSYKDQHNHELLPPLQVHCLHQHQILNTEQKELVHIMLRSRAPTQLIADAVQWKNGTMNEVEDAFNEVKQAAAKSRDPNYIENYFEEWKKDANHAGLKKVIEAASRLEQVFSHIDRAFRQHKLKMNGALGLNIVSADSFILNDKRFKQLLRKISSKALYKLKDKYKSLSDCGSKAIFLDKIEALVAEENVIPKAPLHIKSKRQTSTKRGLLRSEYQDKVDANKRKSAKMEKNIKKEKNKKKEKDEKKT